MKRDQFVVGLIGAPFGLEGFVKVRPLSGEIDHLLKLRNVTVRQGGRERPLEIAESAAMPPAVVMRFAFFGDISIEKGRAVLRERWILE